MRHAPNGQQARTGYDPEQVKHEVLEVCDYYLRERRKEGRRYTYRCPECGGRRFEVEPVRGMAGCFSAECELPKTTDAIGIIGYMEDMDTRGPGFIECLKKGYEILGLDAGDAPRDAPGGRGDKPGSPKARSWIAGEAAGHEGSDNLTASNEDRDETPKTSAGRLVEAYTELPDGRREPLEAFVVEEDTGEIRVSSTATGNDPSSTLGSGPPARRAVVQDEEPATAPDHAQREINHMVFDRLLGMCRLEERDREFLEGRGLDEATLREGRFGSISKRRSRYITERLDKRFADEELLSVPGFYRAESGQLRFSLYGDYVLIPYYDADGYILTVEGRLTGEPSRKDDPKYKALSGSGVHLYVHPRFEPGEAVAFCEGAIGAMVAARCGLPVASIKGFRNYRQPPAGRGGDYSVLPELAGVDFGGKDVVYIPDLDVKPKTRAEAFGVVPEACEWLIERQGGRAKVALLPEGVKDLDEWLLSLAEEERVPEFMKLLRGAVPVEEWDPEGIPVGEAPERASAPGDGEDEGAAEELARIAISDDGGTRRKAMLVRDETPGPGSQDTRANLASANEIRDDYRDGYFKRLPDEAPGAASDADRNLRQGDESASSSSSASTESPKAERSASTTPTQSEDRRQEPQHDSHQKSRENELVDEDRSTREHGAQSAERKTDNGLREEAELARRTHPSMQWWYDVSRQSPEEIGENRRIIERRDWAGYQRPRRKSARLDLRKWDFGEVVIAVVVAGFVAFAACALVYVARPREDLMGTAAELIAFPVWWVEAAMYLALGWGAAAWIAGVRYVSRRRQLLNHVRGKKH